MSLSTIVDARNAEPRETMRRYLYWRAARVGETPTRSFLVALIAWRCGDVPERFWPVPGHYGLPEEMGRAWEGTVEDWIAEAIGRAEFHD